MSLAASSTGGESLPSSPTRNSPPPPAASEIIVVEFIGVQFPEREPQQLRRQFRAVVPRGRRG